MKQFQTVAIESDGSVVRVYLNRPERRNAFDGRMVVELHEAFEELSRDPSPRVVVLAGTGPAFCAGADIQWMRDASPVSEAQAREDAHRLTRMYRAIDECPCPVVGRVHGPAYGGGVGLMAVCDMVVASETATFSLSEAKLGMVPAVIAPFLLRRVGESFVRRYCLSGEPLTAAAAHRYGLVHDLVRPADLDGRIDELIEALLRLGPHAVRESKALLGRILHASDEQRWSLCEETNARIRRSAEAVEGLRAFVEKRPPEWAKPGGRTQDEKPVTHDVTARRT